MTIDVWDLLTIIGTIAFALSGAIVAMEEDFDILGMFILGFVTAFGGGAIRNLLIGLPIGTLWSQGDAFYFALAAMLLIMLFPNVVTKGWLKAEVLTDAIGLASFSVQGAMYAMKIAAAFKRGDCRSSSNRSWWRCGPRCLSRAKTWYLA